MRKISVCSALVHIPTYGESRSLNLAQAVMVTLYELSKLYTAPTRSPAKQTPPAKSKDVEGLKQHLYHVLQEVQYLRKNQEESIRSSFADLIGRARLTDLDVRMLRGFFHRIEVTVQRFRKGLN